MTFALAQLLQDGVDGLFVIDDRQRIVHWDRSCERLFGLSARSVVGRICHQILNQLTQGGEDRCNQRCTVTDMTCAQAVPPSLTLSMRGGGVQPSLKMHTMLVPSEDAAWNVVHMLSQHGAATTRPETAAKPLDAAGERDCDPAAMNGLTRRELEILRLLSAGHSTARMAEILCVSQVTVRNHIQHLLGKMGVHSRLEAVACARRHGLAN